MISNSETKVTYNGNGSTTVFPYTFPLNDADDMHVAIYDKTTEVSTKLTKDYYVDTNAHTVHYPGYAPGQAPALSQQPEILPSTKTITLYRETDVDQLTDLGDKYPLPSIEMALDKVTMILQELTEQLKRSVKVAVGDPETPEERYMQMQTYVSETAANSAASSASAGAAAASAITASTKATEAATSAAQAETSKNTTAGYLAQAVSAANNAITKAAAARESATAAALSASSALSSQNAAAASETTAANSATSAASNQVTASNAAGIAEAAASVAEASVQTAENAMATTAENVAECERIVGTLAAYDVPAWNAATVYSYPDVVAYTDGQTYRCIGGNVPAGTAPRHSTAWVPLTVRGGDDFFEIDMGGNIQSREYPTISATFELDSDGNIMPRATDDESVAIANTAAETYASQAATSATNAANSATAAGNSQTAAANSASAANNSAIAAAASAATATAAVELDADGNVTSTDNGG